ncbi:hypothetical protein CgunFtcFv8_026343 [Champsocephalus gunnari]|uniref:Uncharacterized protein n=1 Tax=Champsocephalus gunnari TaxID=52237 RepID=A0AAN8CCR8_CHAGU|nr:hypothetical protein CgunFtcFv8_026343 [Champsocephalus gunnari]
MHGKRGEGQSGGKAELQTAEKAVSDVKRAAEKAKANKAKAVRKATAPGEEEEDIESLELNPGEGPSGWKPKADGASLEMGSGGEEADGKEKREWKN